MVAKSHKHTIAEWKQILRQLEREELPLALKRVGQAAALGDWQENAEYEDAERQVELLETRISDLKVMIKHLEKGEKK